MSIKTYNRINPPKKTVGDYLQSLNSDELENIYSLTFSYEVKIPELIKKMQDELLKRKADFQVTLI